MTKFAFGAIVGSAITAVLGAKLLGSVVQNPRVNLALKDAVASTVERAIYGDDTFTPTTGRPRFTTVR